MQHLLREGPRVSMYIHNPHIYCSARKCEGRRYTYLGTTQKPAKKDVILVIRLYIVILFLIYSSTQDAIIDDLEYDSISSNWYNNIGCNLN